MSGRARSHPDAWVQLPPAELVATVQLQPTPHIPLASIRELLRPVYDERGELVDWLLHATSFEHPEAVSQFWRWRDTWRPHWPIGPVSNVSALRAAATDIDHDLFQHLDALLGDIVVTLGAGGRQVVVPAAGAPPLLDELRTVRLALSVDERVGFGIVDDMPARSRTTGLLRTWIVPSEDEGEQVLAGTPSSVVVLRPGVGLCVRTGDPSKQPFGPVQAADLRGDVVIVLDALGQSLRMDQHDARPLGWLAPRSLRWHVREVPLVVVWSMAFDGLGTALHAATEAGEPVVITGEPGVA
jgi:hypothetical protein